MEYGDTVGDDGESAMTRTAFREAEKKYQLFRERIMKIKRGKKRAGKMTTRPVDMSDVLDLHGMPRDSLPPGVVRQVVHGYEGPVYTFTRHPGLVFMPGALLGPHQAQLSVAALFDYPEPPARTNHSLHYGPLPGLWRAAQEGLRLNWSRRDEPSAGPDCNQACGRSPAQPHPCSGAGAACAGHGIEAEGPPAAAAAAASPVTDPDPNRGQDSEDSNARPSRPRGGCVSSGLGGSHGQEQGQVPDQPGCSGPGAVEVAQASCTGGRAAISRGVHVTLAIQEQEHQHLGRTDLTRVLSSRQAGASGAGGAAGDCGASAAAACKATAGAQGWGDAGEVADGDDDDRRCCSSNRSSSSGGGAGSERSQRNSGSDCVDGVVEGAPSFEGCWSADGPGPPAEQLLRKLRWATLGPQFEWTERRYDFESTFRPLPPSLEALAKQLAAVVDRLQGAGLQVLPASAAAGGYKPDAAIVNYYQQGDVLGGHLDDVERDMAQPIVSVSLGCPAIFLMGGPTKQVPPSAFLLLGGDVVVLAGEARRCYHGVPRILEAQSCGSAGDGGGRGANAPEADPTESYMRCARINISIRAVA